MHASAIDFVTVLSAEERCALCHELHAAVDQRRCAACEIAMCPDCARSLAHSSWICASCAPRGPASTRLRLRASFVGCLERARTWRRTTSAGQRARTAWRALWLAFAQLWASEAQEVGKLARRAGVLARRARARTVAALQWHVAGWLLGSAILIAVSRAEDPNDHR